MTARSVIAVAALVCGGLWAQSQPNMQQDQPPRSDSSSNSISDLTPAAKPGVTPEEQTPTNPNDSSSRALITDLSPPIGDQQQHPNSQAAQDAADVNELQPWDPHRAAKDIEVGDYYFKQGNYRGAESRYRDALTYKPNDAVATFHLGQICEKTGRDSEAVHFYKLYLNILPHGPFAESARKSVEKLQATLNETVN